MSSESVVEAAAPKAGTATAGRKAAARRARLWPWLLGGAVVVAAGVGLWRYRAGSVKPLDEALIVKVKRGDLAIDVIETGKVQPHDKVDVKSQVAGQVDRVFVDEGEKVTAGQLLLRLDPTNFRRDVAQQQAAVARAVADVASARNALEFARLSLGRKQKGLEGRGVAQVDVELAESDVRGKVAALATYEAVLAGTRVALSAAEDRLRYTKILSPMDGTVLERGIAPGEVVTPGVQATFEGKALLTIADLATLEVKSDLNQIDVAKVQLNQPVTLTLDALPGKKYQAKVTRIAPGSTVPKGKDVDVFPIEAQILDADAAIKPGMTADVRIHVDTRKAVLSLPIEALVKEAGKSFVSRVGVDGRGRQKTDKIEVQVGARNDREAEITSGLSEGDRVLIKPASSAENEYK
jgi:HlyD family secretion protein/macrolide-specific efflux system membrane fusion protein